MNKSGNFLLSRELIEKEIKGYQQAQQQHESNEQDRKLLAAYRSFIRFNVLKTKKSLMLEDYVFSALGKLLCESPTISYETFNIISSSAPEKARKYFSAKNFLLFPKDANKCIESEDFVRYVERSIEIESTIFSLMEFAPMDDPYCTSISEQQLNSYLFRLIPEIDIGNKMHESFREFYVYTASQKFMFFLDTRRCNVVSIKKLAHSSVMEELLFLKRLSNNYHTQLTAEHNGDDEDPATLDLLAELGMEFDSQANSNWFSGNNAIKIYSLFLELDKDQNGMLSLEEIKAFTGFSGGPSGGGDQIQFTSTALIRLFEENITFQPCEMDYRGFVNLVLATENMTSPESVRYFWKLVDFDRSGRLTTEKIKYFYKDIHASLIATNYDAPNANHVALEIFDILACNDSRGPTLSDLIASKQGHTVLTMLLDVNGFWKYDNRESLMAQHASEEEEEKPQAPPPPQQQVAQAPPRTITSKASSFAALNDTAYDDEDFESFDDF